MVEKVEQVSAQPPIQKVPLSSDKCTMHFAQILVIQRRPLSKHVWTWGLEKMVVVQHLFVRLVAQTWMTLVIAKPIGGTCMVGIAG